MTKFVVFVEHAGAWRDVFTVEAASQDAAIRAYAEHVAAKGSDDLIFGNGGALVAAIPARSWKPRTVKAEQKTSVSFS